MNSSNPVARSNDLWRDINWFAIHAKPRRENFAAANIGALGIRILAPRVKVERLVRGSAQQGTKPLLVSPLSSGIYVQRFFAFALLADSPRPGSKKSPLTLRVRSSRQWRTMGNFLLFFAPMFPNLPFQ